ncbi:MAG: phosphoenolpyruvate--protein phosphotransferase [Herbaspirillum sp.]
MVSFTLHGISVSRGIAIGRAHLLAPAALDVKHRLITEDQIEAEVTRLKNAIATVQTELQAIWKELPPDSPVELAAFIDVHALILADPMVAETTLNIIRNRHYNAEWALVTQIDELSAQFDEIEDAYLRERKVDIRQVGERVLKVLLGSAQGLPDHLLNGVNSTDSTDSDEHIIIVAHDISPADMLRFRDSAFSGFVTDLGGQNSHTAIVARSLDIPAVVGMENASELIRQGDSLVIDGDAGVVIVAPNALVLAQYREWQARQLRARKKLTKLKKTAAVTVDGTAITLLANIELPADCAAALAAGAAGVGLFRTEFLFMGRMGRTQKLPDEEEQFNAYKRVVLAMKGRPVTIRTIDVGADKPLDTAEHTAPNPALGLRAIRYCLVEPQIFRTQLRAILRASAFGPVKLLLPMLAHAFEIDQTLALITQAKAELRESGKKFDDALPIGAMIEVPAAALALGMFVKRLDFLSIGTNDLIQYTLAVDRVDHEVAHLYDPLHPAVLRLLAMILAAGRKAGIPVSLCGEIAGDTRMTRLLLGMGLTEFSMQASQLLAVKQEVLNSDLVLLSASVRKILRASEPNVISEAVSRLVAT